jgi:hypothetical protein
MARVITDTTRAARVTTRAATAFAKSIITDVKDIQIGIVQTTEGVPVLVKDGKTAGQVLTDARAAGRGASSTSAATSKVVSRQRQARHILDAPEYNGGGYFNSLDDAQRVLDAYHSGEATMVGTTKTGKVLIEYRGVTGFNQNDRFDYHNQPTHIFMIKGTRSVSIVPYSPGG